MTTKLNLTQEFARFVELDTDYQHDNRASINAYFYAAPSIFKALQVAMEIIEKQREALLKTQEEWPDWDSIRSAISFTDQYLGVGDEEGKF